MGHEERQPRSQTLHECAEACNHCYDACLKEENIKMMAKCIQLNRECADICAFLEHALMRATPFASDLAAVCSKVCEACGSECQKHDYEHCQKCAEACFKCAQVCKEIA